MSGGADDGVDRSSKAKRDAAMADYLGNEQPRLRSSQAPGQPAKRFDQPQPSSTGAAAANKTKSKPSKMEREVDHLATQHALLEETIARGIVRGYIYLVLLTLFIMVVLGLLAALVGLVGLLIVE